MPKTRNEEEPAEVEESEPTEQTGVDAPVEESPPAEEAPVEPAGPSTIPARVETFSVGDNWGWRQVATDGTVITETQLEWTTQRQALQAAKQDDTNDGLTFVDQDTEGLRRTAW